MDIVNRNQIHSQIWDRVRNRTRISIREHVHEGLRLRLRGLDNESSVWHRDNTSDIWHQIRNQAREEHDARLSE